MINRYAVVDDNGNIVNVIEAPDDFEIEGHTLVLDTDIKARIGGTYQSKKFKDPDLPDQINDYLTMIDEERDRRIAFGFQFQDKWFQADSFATANINGAATAASMAVGAGVQPGDLRWSNPEADFAWIAEDNTLLPMDAQTTIQFGLTAMANRSKLIMKARDIKDSVIAGTAVDIADDATWQ